MLIEFKWFCFVYYFPDNSLYHFLSYQFFKSFLELFYISL